MSLPLDALRPCFEGVVPAVLASADLEGTPHLSYVAQVLFVDSRHIALPDQFFKQTRANLLANPHAVLAVTDPVSAAQYRLTLRFLRSESGGHAFDSLHARMAALASHTGMTGVFALNGALQFEVCALEQVAGVTLPVAAPRRDLLAALRNSSAVIRPQAEVAPLLDEVLASLAQEFGIEHAMVLLPAPSGASLHCVAALGYPEPGPQGLIKPGEGVIGAAARYRMPVRVGHTTAAYGYARAIRASTVTCGFGDALEDACPPPGLTDARSELAVPMMAGPHLVGVLYVESGYDLRFGFQDEDALMSLAGQLGMTIAGMQARARAEAAAPPPPPGGEALLVRHFPENDSIFFGDDYLIKGVAGAILAVLVADYIEQGRTEFTNRELRLDPRVRLPGFSDNLEGRLLLLSRRLEERQAGITIEKTGRGRFRLCTNHPLKLVPGVS